MYTERENLCQNAFNNWFVFTELCFDLLNGIRDKEMHLIMSDTTCQYIYIYSILHTYYLTKGISVATSRSERNISFSTNRFGRGEKISTLPSKQQQEFFFFLQPFVEILLKVFFVGQQQYCETKRVQFWCSWKNVQAEKHPWIRGQGHNFFIEQPPNLDIFSSDHFNL